MTDLRCYSTAHNAENCIEAGCEPDEMCSNCRNHYDATTGADEVADVDDAATVDRFEPDLSDTSGETHRWVDHARRDASTMKAVGWMYPDDLPAMAHNYRTTAAILLEMARALEMEELEGKDALGALMDRIPVPVVS